MKTLVTVLSLLFSTSVFAKGEDLKGKSIVCGYTSDETVIIVGIAFYDNYEVDFYDKNANSASTQLNTTFYYETSFSLIKIFNSNEPGFVQVDRKTLNITFHEELKEVDDEINGKYCSVYQNQKIGMNIIKLNKKLVDQIKAGNKI